MSGISKESWALLGGSVLAAGLGYLIWREMAADKQAKGDAKEKQTVDAAGAAVGDRKAREKRPAAIVTAAAAGAGAGVGAGVGAVMATPAKSTTGAAAASAKKGVTLSSPPERERGSPSATPASASASSRKKKRQSYGSGVVVVVPGTPGAVTAEAIAEEFEAAVDDVVAAVAGSATADDDAGAAGGSPQRAVPRADYDEDLVNANALVERAVALYASVFGAVKEYKYSRTDLLVAIAPGRVNIIGEHTDYNDGWVMPMAIDRACVVVGRPNGLNKWRLASGNVSDAKAPQVLEFDAAAMAAKDKPVQWHNYLRGVVAMYGAGDADDAPVVIPGFDALVLGDVPLGGGLSSSAALEVATATFLDGLVDKAIPNRVKALRCQHAEQRYAFMPCGIMDQFISVHAERDHAMLLDCRTLERKAVKMDNPGITLLITNSNVKHQLTGGEYAERRAQCEAAVAVLKQKYPKISALRDATMGELDSVKAQLGSADAKDAKASADVIYRRAKHVITEDDRTLLAAAAFDRGDYTTVGKLMRASHDSLRDDFEVSCSELDVLVEIASEQKGVYGSRMTGGGFGGCTVTLVKTADAQRVAAALQAEYKKRTGKDATTLTSRACDGTRLLKLL